MKGKHHFRVWYSGDDSFVEYTFEADRQKRRVGGVVDFYWYPSPNCPPGCLDAEVLRSRDS